MFKEARVILAAHSNIHTTLTLYVSRVLSTNLDRLEYHSNQHLYIVSDDIIKAGDMVINTANNNIREAEEDHGSVGYTHGPAFLYFNKLHKKIIATTNPELKRAKGKIQIAQIRPNFILQFVDAYNRFQPIKDILVEYSAKKGTEDYHVKTSIRSNAITIKVHKTNWKKKEVEKLIREAFDLYRPNSAGYPGLEKSRKAMEDKFIEDKL